MRPSLCHRRASLSRSSWAPSNAFYLYPSLAPAGVPRSAFVLFFGVAMSVTAFPVLARILADRHMSKTPLGTLALTCAAIWDVSAWCLLAVVLGVLRVGGGSGLLTIALTVAFIVLMFVVVRPAAVRLFARLEARSADETAIAVALASMIAAALATDAIGIHAIFGAFLAGAVIPSESRLAPTVDRRLGKVAKLLLPAFFAFAGTRTEVGLLSGVGEWATCLSIIFLATAGKFGGAMVAGRATGLRWRHAAALGALMNTRGLMEIIVLNVGLDLGIITPTLFTMMVVMALATTIATAPLLRIILGRERETQDVLAGAETSDESFPSALRDPAPPI